MLVLSTLFRCARLCGDDARPTFAVWALASAAGWGGHRKYMSKQIVTYTYLNEQKEILMNSWRLLKERFFNESIPKEF